MAPAKPGKSGERSGELVPQAHGGALRKGSAKGNTPGTGRPPSWLRDKCAKILEQPQFWAEVDRVIKDSDHPQWQATTRWLADRAYGKPIEAVELSGPERKTLKVVLVRE